MPLVIRLNRVIQVSDSEVDTYLSNGYRLYTPEDNNRDNEKSTQQPIRETEASEEINPLAGMDIEQLKAYAAENCYDIGNASSTNGIIKKIEKAKTVAKGGGVGATE